MALMIPLEEATKIVAEAMTDAYERGRGIGEAERKVIEAAKALHKRGSTLEEMDLIDEVDMAVEDLLAAEVEG